MPPLSIINVENAIRLLCATLSGIEFYHAYQDVARNEGTYGTVRLTSISPVGYPYRAMTDEIVDDKTYVKNSANQNVIATFSINAFRFGARDCLNSILAGWSLQQSDDILYPANLGFVWSSDIRDLTTEIEGNFEERAQMDLTFNGVLEKSEYLEIIETAQFYFTNFNRTFEVMTND